MNEGNNRQTNNVDNNTLSNKEQNQKSAEKAGQLAGRGALDYATGGQYEKIRNMPVVGNQAKKLEDKVGNRVGKIDKATGGKIGKAAKKLDDAGALDAANKGLGLVGGNMGKNSTGNVQPNSVSHPGSSQPNSSPQPNFAKNGLNNNSDNISVGNNSGAISKRFRDINGRKNDNESNVDNSRRESESRFNNIFKKSDKSKVLISVEIDNLVKKTLIPLLFGLFLTLLLSFIFMSQNNDNDLAAVDDENGEGGAYYYSNADSDVEAYYNRVKKVEKDYSNNGKNINKMYITAAYHVLTEYQKGVNPKKITESDIKKLADGMLGDSTSYSESTYRSYLENTFFPEHDIKDKQAKKATDRVFEYIKQYMDEHHPSDNNCTTTTGSSCIYKINGIHGSNHGPLDLNNLHVSLIGNSSEGLVPFEDYVLSVAYQEVGPSFNKEAQKVQLIAARSYAIARPILMNGANGLKYEKKNDKTILHIRGNTNDQAYCNYKKGCGNRGPLEQVSNGATLKKSWEDTIGMVALDANDKVVNMPYIDVNQNRWNSLANSGKDYTQIILSEYPDVKNIKKMNCSDTTEKSGSAFLQVAQKLWKQIANGGYSYGATSIPPTGKLIDCSAFVDWVLAEYGFNEFKGGQKNTVVLVNTNWKDKFGWEEIPVKAGENVVSKLKPGDILVRDAGGGANGHVNIVAEVKNGHVYVYDCGGSDNWNNATARAGKPIENTSFAASDSRAGKIIRVSNVSGNSCVTADAGEAASWKQYDEKWGGIHLGNSSQTIKSWGCYVTSIAIQIARSGVKTTISNFNPGTFVKELNKYNGFDAGGNYNGDAATMKIVPGFKQKYQINLSGSASDKVNKIKEYLDQGLYPTMRVKTTNGQHWVAVIGVSGNDVIMADPGSSKTQAFATYSVGECSTLNVYEIK